MSIPKSPTTRRGFLKRCSLSSLPILVPPLALGAKALETPVIPPEPKEQLPLNFMHDGIGFSPSEYLQQLQIINANQPIQPDFYGNGGATSKLEEAFARITGKEKAILLPTGTMANQLAIKLLNQQNTKAIVPENSHIFRDEADAAQAVHRKRLIPLGKGQAYFTQQDLEAGIAYYNQGEVFKSGLGTIAIENPIRRADGVAIPLQTLKDLSTYSRDQGYKLHLDGARLHIASAYTGVSIKEYAALFDTVYISLYKYLNASGGAMLCGDASVIDLIQHQIKIHGGTLFQSWNISAMALHYLDGLEERWQEVIQVIEFLKRELNKEKGVSLSALTNGTNIYNLKLDPSIDLRTLAQHLHQKHQIGIAPANPKGIVKITVNESLLRRDRKALLQAWQESIAAARQ